MMAFLTLETIVFQNEKKNTSTAILFLLLSVCYPVNLLKVKDDIIFVKERCQRGLKSQNLMF